METSNSPLLSSTPKTQRGPLSIKDLKTLSPYSSSLIHNNSPMSNVSYGTEQYSPMEDEERRTSTPIPFSKLRDSEESPDTVIVAFAPLPNQTEDNDKTSKTLNFYDTDPAETATQSLKDMRANGLLVPFGEEQPEDGSLTKTTKVDLDKLPAFKSAIFCVIPLFMGYACLFSLQGKIKDVYGITTHGERFDQFGNAVSFLYMGNLVFRFAHNILFFCFSPRIRVLIAMLSMVCALNLLLWGVFICKLTHTLAWVYGAYALGGVAVGSFEANLLSSITPLGHQTKLWATLGKVIIFSCFGFNLLICYSSY
jgi:hypothetical protein